MNHSSKTLLTFMLSVVCACKGTAQTPTDKTVDPRRLAEARSYQAYLNQISVDIEQIKIDIERQRLRELEARARNDDSSARDAAARAKNLQNRQQIKQLESSMYLKAGTNLTKPRSIFPAIANAQDEIGRLEMEKDRQAIAQAKASQSGNQAEAAAAGQQITSLGARITAKQQEIRLLELQTKTNR